MKRFVVSLSALLLSAGAVTAADDPVAVRKALMQANAAAAATATAMIRGQMEYSPTVAKAAIATLHASALASSGLFPEGSNTGDTEASPRIWEDPEGFQQANAKFQADSAAAVQVSGRQGPADLATFQQAVGPVLANCGSCHETFRID